MTRKLQQELLLAPMEEAELTECLRIIYSKQLPANPYKLLAEDLGIEFEIVAAWSVGLSPFPKEVACGLRVRAAAMQGELPSVEEAALSVMSGKLVLRWILECASHNELVRLFSALAAHLHARRNDAP